MKFQIQEKEMKSFFSLSDDLMIFDIGSHNGDSTLRYKSIFPNAKVNCFEPVPSNFDDLQKNTKTISNVSIFQIALSARNEETTFYLSNADNVELGSKSSSLLSPTAEIKSVTPWLKFEHTIKVITKTLETFCAEQNIQHIDFVHMDVQGAELLVLQGANKMLNQIDMIWMEVENVELYKGQPLKKDVFQYLSSHGFELVIDDVNWVAGDQLWIRKDFLHSKKGRGYMINKQVRNSIFSFYYFVRGAVSKLKHFFLS